MPARALTSPCAPASAPMPSRMGFVMAMTNTGHDARKEPQASFVMSNPQKAIDYAYRAVHLTADDREANRGDDYYAKRDRVRTGTRARTAAVRVSSRRSAIPTTSTASSPTRRGSIRPASPIGALWNQRALTEAPIPIEEAGARRRTSSWRSATRSTVSPDGLIDDPRRCDFDPARDVPACQPAPTLRSVSPPRRPDASRRSTAAPMSGGKPYLPRLHVRQRGHDGRLRRRQRAADGSNVIMPRQADVKPADFSLAESTMKYLVFPQPQARLRLSHVRLRSRHPARSIAGGKLANANNPDLSGFNKRGGSS